MNKPLLIILTIIIVFVMLAGLSYILKFPKVWYKKDLMENSQAIIEEQMRDGSVEVK